MFTVYHSNQLDLLKELTSQVMTIQPLNSVFSPEIILVQSHGMGQWLQIQLAEKLDVAANIHYPFPTQFVWDIYRIFYPDLPKSNIFDIDFMTWILLDILPDLIKQPQFTALQNYFDFIDDKQKYYQLASMMAQLFDQYLVYRPDWLKAWENNQIIEGIDQTQLWQAALWRELVFASKKLTPAYAHRSEIHMNVIKALNNKLSLSVIEQLPKRIFVFGIVSLPPMYLELFYSLSKYIDVHFMFMNPCRQYWGDIIDHSFLTKYAHTDETLDNVIQTTNPLLASWGKLGRDHLALLQHYTDKNDIEAFVDYDNRTLLSMVQQSILEMNNQSFLLKDHEPDASTLSIAMDDYSIEFHSCHSEQREVEVLYDNLLAIFDNHPDINLNDCVVMVADIDHYAPYIQAVFDNAPKHRYLPYTIADQKLKYIDPIVQGFFLLLDLPHSRLEIEYIFDLLEIPAIAKRFSFNEANLIQLRNWIVDSGIRWGLESEIDKPHSWIMGLHRMLLGYTMESKLDSWQNIVPYDEVTGLNAELIGFLSEFIMMVAKWRDTLTQSHSISDWQHLCLNLLTDFFFKNAESEPLLLMIENQWQDIILQAKNANYNGEIDTIILKNFIQTKFNNNYLSHRFLIGKINFCTLMPMRSVPFKVVCLLGMNDGVYPRTTSPLGFDLINRHGRLGDRSRRNDDRYLFLEALLSAEQKLYISYIGRDMQTNEPRYPSILVDELLNYIKQSYQLDDDNEISMELRVKNLTQHLIRQHTRMPFDIQNYQKITGSVLRPLSYADEWLLAAKRCGKIDVFNQPLHNQAVTMITLTELKQFYLHPIKFLTKKRLGYFINIDAEQLPDAENFNLNNLQRFYINNQILNQFMLEKDKYHDLDDKLYNKMLHSNQLPYGAFGQLLYSEQKSLMQTLMDRIYQERVGEYRTLDINLPIQSINLIGRITNLQSDGILQWCSSKLTIKNGLSLWIDHLIICALQPYKDKFLNRLYGRDESKWSFENVSADEALKLLSVLMEGYLEGLNQPLFMPLQSAWKWLDVAFDNEKQTISDDVVILSKAKASFREQWQNSIGSNAECDDYYYRLYPELNDELIDCAINALKRYLLPIIQYRHKEN
ncbi:exodeoxyribonuclease V subunit gamma [Frischella perrara]|uniref:RecBCD enzyme subunit RecC n=1 Tax=Frischella perrara TaxID=1267021 RepID=A0A318MYN5_FRIPE|nr:exodeoxyribonuclease V subunit gamma [Frischella perrara]PXY96737.1 exodeoxyribonuclease V subunit gamma [Frischella perrara]